MINCGPLDMRLGAIITRRVASSLTVVLGKSEDAKTLVSALTPAADDTFAFAQSAVAAVLVSAPGKNTVVDTTWRWLLLFVCSVCVPDGHRLSKSSAAYVRRSIVQREEADCILDTWDRVRCMFEGRDFPGWVYDTLDVARKFFCEADVEKPQQDTPQDHVIWLHVHGRAPRECGADSDCIGLADRVLQAAYASGIARSTTCDHFMLRQIAFAEAERRGRHSNRLSKLQASGVKLYVRLIMTEIKWCMSADDIARSGRDLVPPPNLGSPAGDPEPYSPSASPSQYIAHKTIMSVVTNKNVLDLVGSVRCYYDQQNKWTRNSISSATAEYKGGHILDQTRPGRFDHQSVAVVSIEPLVHCNGNMQSLDNWLEELVTHAPDKFRSQFLRPVKCLVHTKGPMAYVNLFCSSLLPARIARLISEHLIVVDPCTWFDNVQCIVAGRPWAIDALLHLLCAVATACCDQSRLWQYFAFALAKHKLMDQELQVADHHRDKITVWQRTAAVCLLLMAGQHAEQTGATDAVFSECPIRYPGKWDNWLDNKQMGFDYLAVCVWRAITQSDTHHKTKAARTSTQQHSPKHQGGEDRGQLRRRHRGESREVTKKTQDQFMASFTNYLASQRKGESWDKVRRLFSSQHDSDESKTFLHDLALAAGSPSAGSTGARLGSSDWRNRAWVHHVHTLPYLKPGFVNEGCVRPVIPIVCLPQVRGTEVLRHWFAASL